MISEWARAGPRIMAALPLPCGACATRQMRLCLSLSLFCLRHTPNAGAHALAPPGPHKPSIDTARDTP